MTPIPIPEAIKKLPVDPVRGFVVPWFVRWFDGKPEFRVADREKVGIAYHERRCWICGGRLDNRSTYVVGPLCVLNRISGEPASHPACAEYAVVACPFLSRPKMVRREAGMPEVVAAASKVGMIDDNPGVSCLWTGRVPGGTMVNAGGGQLLFQLHAPMRLSWWAEGRAATRAEVDAGVALNLPKLRAEAESKGPSFEALLDRMIADAQPYFEGV